MLSQRGLLGEVFSETAEGDPLNQHNCYDTTYRVAV